MDATRGASVGDEQTNGTADEQWDVVVVGSGPGGLTTAACLAAAGSTGARARAPRPGRRQRPGVPPSSRGGRVRVRRRRALHRRLRARRALPQHPRRAGRRRPDRLPPARSRRLRHAAASPISSSGSPPTGTSTSSASSRPSPTTGRASSAAARRCATWPRRVAIGCCPGSRRPRSTVGPSARSPSCSSTPSCRRSRVPCSTTGPGCTRAGPARRRWPCTPASSTTTCGGPTTPRVGARCCRPG